MSFSIGRLWWKYPSCFCRTDSLCRQLVYAVECKCEANVYIRRF